jgi:hypothetical protein
MELTANSLSLRPPGSRVNHLQSGATRAIWIAIQTQTGHFKGSPHLQAVSQDLTARSDGDIWWLRVSDEASC